MAGPAPTIFSLENFTTGSWWSYNESFLDYGNSSQWPPTSHTQGCDVFLFIFFTVITGLLCVLGLTGNVISMLVLQKDRGGRVHAATFLLQALAVADNCVLGMSFIFLSIIFGLLPILEADDARRRMVPYIVAYVQPVAYMAQTATVWMTVLLAVNRFVAICRPFDTHRLASLKRSKLQVAIVFIFAVLFNLPCFFQHEVHYDDFGMPELRVTSIGPRSIFGKVYTTGLYTVIVLLLPLIVLVILNGKLILELKKMSKRRDSIQDQRRSEENITLVMIVIIIVFIVCNTPDRINILLRHFYRAPKCSPYYYFDCVSNFLIVANSSTNFLVYYIFRRRFRQILLTKLRCSPTKSRENGYELNGHSPTSEHRHAVTLLTTNGMTCNSQAGDLQTVV